MQKAKKQQAQQQQAQQAQVQKTHTQQVQSSVLVTNTSISAAKHAQQQAQQVFNSNYAANNNALLSSAAQSTAQLNTRKVSIKQKVRAVFESSPNVAFSLEQLCELTLGTQVTVKTALSDLKNAKYAGGNVLNIQRTANKLYMLVV